MVEALRAEIAQLQPGARLLSQHALSERLDVSRDTVQRALRELRAEGLITSTTGSGSFVAETTGEGGDEGGDGDELEPAIIALDHYLDDALREEHVTIDFFGFSAETLTTLLKPRLDRLKLARSFHPDSLKIRLLLPTTDVRLALPRAVDNPKDPRPLERLRRMTTGFVDVLQEAVNELRVREVVPEASLQVMAVPMTPQVKLYVINREVALRGWYEVERAPVEVPVSEDGRETELLEIYDLMGLDASLIRQRPSAARKAQTWFESVWNTIAVEWPGDADQLAGDPLV
ncbi:winged helix-turn-helix domain-containing protein [Streptacidiphilus sp. MAP12-16]|uniref:winged helix-turn-helix domain-containing protein n=1 Tax=Streptacidiphilus sp. MAP12-16 TaxID=3156300 RepID=UPI003512832C